MRTIIVIMWEVIFTSKNHVLRAYNDGALLNLDFPADTIYQIPFASHLDCFDTVPLEVWRGTEEYLLVFESHEQVENAVCNLKKATEIDLEGFIITAKAHTPDLDFVSRYFAPKIGIDEDPVTGSAHTLLVPYWSKVTGKTQFNAAQLSKRGGRLICRLDGDRVMIGGKAVTYSVGQLLI